MVNRWIGILSACCAILATAEVFRRDVLPDWLPDQAPPSDALLLAPGEKRFGQVGIYDGQMREIGRSWTCSTRLEKGDLVQLNTMTVLGPLHLAGGLSFPRVRIETNVQYRWGKKCVDDLEFRLHGLGMPIMLKAGWVETGDFPCIWQVGTQRGQFMLDSRAPEALGDVIRPFDRLPNLYVGQRWRLDLLNPLAQMLPKGEDGALELNHVVIEVTGTETIEHQGQSVETFVVEGGGAKAWVDRDGRVLKQAVENLPLLGSLILLDEPYSATARRAAESAVPKELP